MGLFGGKDDTRQKIEELKAKMQQGGAPQQQQQAPQGWQPPAQPWQQQQNYQAPEQPWQQESKPMEQSYDYDELPGDGIIIDLGDGMSLNLPVKSRMRLDEFLRIADRVRELKKIEHPQHY